MSAPERPRRRKRDRRGSRGGFENRRPVRANLEPRARLSSKKPLLRSETGENDALGARFRPIVGPGQYYGTPNFDPSEPVPFVLTEHGRRSLEGMRARGELEEDDRERPWDDDELEDDDELDDDDELEDWDDDDDELEDDELERGDEGQEDGRDGGPWGSW